MRRYQIQACIQFDSESPTCEEFLERSEYRVIAGLRQGESEEILVDLLHGALSQSSGLLDVLAKRVRQFSRVFLTVEALIEVDPPKGFGKNQDPKIRSDLRYSITTKRVPLSEIPAMLCRLPIGSPHGGEGMVNISIHPRS